MRFLENDTLDLLKAQGVKILPSNSLSDFSMTSEFLSNLEGESFILRACSYERGKERFSDPVTATNKEEAKQKIEEILEEKFTDIHTEKKIPVTEIIFHKNIPYKISFYLSIFFDGSNAKTVSLASKRKLNPRDYIDKEGEDHITVSVDFASGFTPFMARKISYFLNMENEAVKKTINTFKIFYEFYLKYDLKVLNLGPLYLDQNNEIIVSGANMVMDRNSAFRHQQMNKFATDSDGLQDLELEAYLHDISYVMFNGNIGCLVNGTGIGLSVVDSIRHKGGEIAAFVDVGGNAAKDRIRKAISIMLKDKHIKIILINCFCGMIKCDEVAYGILEAFELYKIDVPLIVRLEGINRDPAIKLLEHNSQIEIISDLLGAVNCVVEKSKHFPGE